MGPSARIAREQLEFQANRIERLLAAHRVPVRVAGGSVTPRWIRFDLAPSLGARIASIRNLSEELSVALGTSDVRLGRDGEKLMLEILRPDAEPVRLLPLLRQLPPVPAFTACLGLADNGRPLLIRLSSPDVAHILVAGATGSGKTELLRSIVVSLAVRHRQSQLQLALIDPKRRGFGPLAHLPHLVAPVASGPDETLELLNPHFVRAELVSDVAALHPELDAIIDRLCQPPG